MNLVHNLTMAVYGTASNYRQPRVIRLINMINTIIVYGNCLTRNAADERYHSPSLHITPHLTSHPGIQHRPPPTIIPNRTHKINKRLSHNRRQQKPVCAACRSASACTYTRIHMHKHNNTVFVSSLAGTRIRRLAARYVRFIFSLFLCGCVFWVCVCVMSRDFISSSTDARACDVQKRARRVEANFARRWVMLKTIRRLCRDNKQVGVLTYLKTK